MNELTLQAYGKINLGLDIVGKAENGYHLLKMVMQSVNLSDTITMKKIENGTSSITLTTNHKELPTNSDNLIYKAAKLLMEEFHITDSVSIHLEKRIPIAAGMAGGSTDAAAVLKGMNTLFSLSLSQKDLMERGVTLGADIPYCIMGGTALSEGIGEILTPIDTCLQGYIILVKPPVNVSTKWAYQNFRKELVTSPPDIDLVTDSLKKNDLATACKGMENVLEAVTIPAHPIIQTIKKRMLELGCSFSLMSGSGPTVFGLCAEEEKAAEITETLKQEFSDSFVTLTTYQS